MSFSRTSKFSAMIPKLNTYFLYHHSFHSKATQGNFLVRSGFKSNNQPGTFTCKRTRCKTYPLFLTQLRSQDPIDPLKSLTISHASINAIYCITCTLCKKIYIGETGGNWRTASANTYEMQNKTTQMRPNQLRPILIFLIIPTTTSLFAGYPYITGTQKSAKI